MEANTTITGKRGEYKVIGKLMEEGFTIYTPVADVEGIDCIIRNDKCRLIEIQIKTRNKDGQDNRLFKVKNLTPNKNFFVCCYFIDTNELWVVPSYTFYELSTQEEDKRVLSMNIKNQLALSRYKDNLGIGLLRMGEMPERKA